MRLDGLAMVTSPTGKGVIAMGGINFAGIYSMAIFELTQSMVVWTRLEQTLQIGHWAPPAIPILEEKNNSKISPPISSPILDLSPLSTSLYFLIGGILLALLMLYFMQ